MSMSCRSCLLGGQHEAQVCVKSSALQHHSCRVEQARRTPPRSRRNVHTCADTSFGEQDRHAITRRRRVLALSSATLAILLPPDVAGWRRVAYAAQETMQARVGDLVLAHFVAYVDDGRTEFFDGTRGGATYLDGGSGVFRPAVLVAGGAVKPGQPKGLLDRLVGLKAGESATFTLEPEEAFGSATAQGPYGVVPGGSRVRYEVEVLRVSRDGPDKLFEGISKCGAGGAFEQDEGCKDI